MAKTDTISGNPIGMTAQLDSLKMAVNKISEAVNKQLLLTSNPPSFSFICPNAAEVFLED